MNYKIKHTERDDIFESLDTLIGYLRDRIIELTNAKEYTHFKQLYNFYQQNLYRVKNIVNQNLKNDGDSFLLSEEKLKEIKRILNDLENLFTERISQYYKVIGYTQARHAFILYRQVLWDIKNVIAGFEKVK